MRIGLERTTARSEPRCLKGRPVDEAQPSRYEAMRKKAVDESEVRETNMQQQPSNIAAAAAAVAATLVAAAATVAAATAALARLSARRQSWHVIGEGGDGTSSNGVAAPKGVASSGSDRYGGGGGGEGVGAERVEIGWWL